MKKFTTILCLFTLATLVLSSCYRHDERIMGYGPSFEVVADIDMRRVTAVETDGSIDIEVVPSDYYEAVVTAQENIHHLISIRILGNTAKVSLKPHYRAKPTDVTKVTFFIPYLTSAISSGSGDIYCFSGFTSNDRIDFRTNGSGDIFASGLICRDLHTTINGSGDINITDMECYDLNVNVRGSGDIDIYNFFSSKLRTKINGSGSVNYRGLSEFHILRMEGSGKVEAYNLKSRVVEVDVLGSGNSYLNVSDYLDVTINGSGNIYYRGYPTLSVRSYGSGKVYQR